MGVGALLLLAVEIWIPWAVARLWASPIVYHTWPLWQAAAVALWPLMLGARFVDTILHRLAGRVPEIPNEESFEDEIRTIVTEGHREGLLEEDARGMIEGIMELGDLDVSEIMTPRTDMVSIPVSLAWPEMLQFVINQGHTRIPVHDKNRDDIVGILHTKDLLPELAKGPAGSGQPWTALLREAYFVPETKPIDVLLQEFQRSRHHMAVVLDEYGGVSGLVTMEDVLEEIVGEIIDEYDKALVDGIKAIDERVFEVAGQRPHRRDQRATRARSARGRRLRHDRRPGVQRIGSRPAGGRGTVARSTSASRSWKPPAAASSASASRFSIR